MAAVFRQAKEEQEKSDQALMEEQQKSINSIMVTANDQKTTIDTKPKRRSRKGLEPSKISQLTGESFKSLVPGATVRVLSGPFKEYSGCLKELDPNNGKARIDKHIHNQVKYMKCSSLLPHSSKKKYVSMYHMISRNFIRLTVDTNKVIKINLILGDC